MSSIELLPARAGDLSSPAEWLPLGLQDLPAGNFVSVVEDVLSQVTKPVRAERWGAFWAIQSIEGQVRAVGLCSHKTEPNDLGEVEIAYYAFPHREGRGVATAMVDALTLRAASAAPDVAFVVTHTLPVENASCKVLRRCCYALAGTAFDPEDGLVWRWRVPAIRASASS